MTWWAEQARLLVLATQLLTRLPVRAAAPGPGELARCLRYAPLVGIGVGLAATAVMQAPWPRPVAAVLAVAAMALLTGGLHEDGLADACDGLFGGRTRADALRIMKDSRIGVFGALGLGLATAVRVLAVAMLPGAGVVAAQAISRLGMALLSALPSARPDGTGALAAGGPGRVGGAIAAATALAAALVAGRAGWCIAAAGLAAAAFGWWVRRRLGGVTGDVLGAAQQTTELAVYLVLLWRAG